MPRLRREKRSIGSSPPGVTEVGVAGLVVGGTIMETIRPPSFSSLWDRSWLSRRCKTAINWA